MTPRNDPVPFLVGAPRSGTTLLRLMLDGHSALAIPPETGFLPVLGERLAEGPVGRAELLELVTGFPPGAPAWLDFGLERAAYAAALAALEPFDPVEGARAFYRMYAARHGKPRWGDKTPLHALHLQTISGLLPEARFVHLIRDGRDVAVSLAEQWFGPGRDPAALAAEWARFVGAARSSARAVPHYLEVRFEELVREPRRVLASVCEFLALPFEEALATPWRRAPRRLAEHRERRLADGSLQVSRQRRWAQQRSATKPLDPAKIGIFRQRLTADEIDRFERVAGGLLAELGYPLGS